MNDEPTDISEDEKDDASPGDDSPEEGRGFTLVEPEDTPEADGSPQEAGEESGTAENDSGDSADSAPDGEGAGSGEENPDGEENAGDADGDVDDGPEDGDAEDADDSDAEEGDGADENGVSPLPVAAIVEAVLFAAREPLKLAQIARAVGKRTRQDAVRAAIDELNVQYLETSRAFEIAEISGRFQLMSRPEYADHIMRIYPKRELADKETKSQRLTPAMLDTLAIVAYKQPVMRSEIEHIRGVACGPVLRTLIERGSVREVGRRADLVGKPAVFGTTERFLAEFGLGSIEELPMRNEFITPGAEARVEMTVVEPEPVETPENDGEEDGGTASEENPPEAENASSAPPEGASDEEPVELDDDAGEGEDEDESAEAEPDASTEEGDVMQEAEDELSEE